MQSLTVPARRLTVYTINPQPTSRPAASSRSISRHVYRREHSADMCIGTPINTSRIAASSTLRLTGIVWKVRASPSRRFGRCVRGLDASSSSSRASSQTSFVDRQLPGWVPSMRARSCPTLMVSWFAKRFLEDSRLRAATRPRMAPGASFPTLESGGLSHKRDTVSYIVCCPGICSARASGSTASC